MHVFAISDLHLALAEDKPMDVFGSGWENYMQRIKQNWEQCVSADDLVLLPGDLSWATYLEQAGPDFQYIEALPGKKIITKGNHDYWWTTKSKLKKYLEKENLQSVSFLQNDACIYNHFAVVGSRGWRNPADEGFTEEDQKIWLRELERLKLSLQATAGFDGTIIAMLHYPPFTAKGKPTAIVEILKSFGVKICIYGHLHGKKCYSAITGEQDGIRYHLVSADYLNFWPKLLGEW